MSEKAEVKSEALPDLDDLLQCPVCYEIPSGQIFQCNEGHHVCGQCKSRLDVCPVCRALFFGTRNYAMEELLANIRKLRAFKLGGKVTTGSVSPESSTPAQEAAIEDVQNDNTNEVESVGQSSTASSMRPPQACKGLFRCLVCKNGNGERLPLGRMLNHLRYYHSPELIEGQSENGEYVQAWQFPTAPGRIVIAVRVADMGIFFLIIEINNDNLSVWLTMAASPWVAHEFCYTITISGNDREAIFSDCVWSVRSCEGSLKKRGHCLLVTGQDARALVAPAALSGKLSVRRAPPDPLASQSPRTVLRVANRGNPNDIHHDNTDHAHQDLEPFLLDLQIDVARLSRAFATLGREATALARSEAQIRARLENAQTRTSAIEPPANFVAPATEEQQASDTQAAENDRAPLSRNARRRQRRREREQQLAAESSPAVPAHRVNIQVQGQNGPTSHRQLGTSLTPQPPVPPPSTSGPSNDNNQNGNHPTHANKKKRRHRR